MLEKIRESLSSLDGFSIGLFILAYLFLLYIYFSKIIISEIEEIARITGIKEAKELAARKSLSPKYLCEAAIFILEEEKKNR